MDAYVLFVMIFLPLYHKPCLNSLQHICVLVYKHEPPYVPGPWQE